MDAMHALVEALICDLVGQKKGRSAFRTRR